MQIADDVVAVATALVDQCLAMAADVGDELDLASYALEHLAVSHPSERMVVAFIGHHQRVAVVLRGVGEQDFLLDLVKGRIEIGMNG